MNVCIGQCPRLVDIENGAVSIDSRFVDNVATYTCDDGYELVGESSPICRQTGEWSSSPPSCDRKWTQTYWLMVDYVDQVNASCFIHMQLLVQPSIIRVMDLWPSPPILLVVLPVTCVELGMVWMAYLVVPVNQMQCGVEQSLHV